MADTVYAHKYKYFAVGALGTFMATLDGSIVNVALPSIADNLHVNVDLVSWVVLSYSLTLISLMLVFGAWTRQRGYFFGYRFGYVFFLVGSIICALAPGIYLLIAGRVIQATGTAMFAAIGPGMVTAVFPKGERGKGLGMMVMMVSAGFMVGPPLGGMMLGIWSWHSLFIINVPIGLIGLLMVYRYLGSLSSPRGGRPTGIASAMAMSTSLLAAVFAIKMATRWGPHDPRIMGLVIVALVSLGLFLKLESQPEHSLIGLSIFRNRQFTTAVASQQMHFISLSGVIILVPFYLERVRGYEPMQVGLFLVTIPILMFIFAPLSGRLSDRIGYRILTSFGMAAMGVALYLLSLLSVDSSGAYIIGCLILGGLGVGTFSTPNSSAMMGSVPESDRAVVSSILATSRNIGQSMGVGIATALFALFEARHSLVTDARELFLIAYKPVIYVSLGFIVVGLLLCLTRPEPKTA